MGAIHIDSHVQWRGLPLCSRYLLVHFAGDQSQAFTGAAAHSWSLTWALGAVSNGQTELLGVWPHAVDGMLDWHAVFADLAVRGVDRIGYAVHADAIAAQATFPNLTLLGTARAEPSGREAAAGQGARRSAETRGAGGTRLRDANDPPRRVLQLARRVHRAAQLLQRGLTQAASRHGPFDSSSAAASFVEAWLTSAEARQRRRLAKNRAAGAGAAAVPP